MDGEGDGYVEGAEEAGEEAGSGRFVSLIVTGQSVGCNRAHAHED